MIISNCQFSPNQYTGSRQSQIIRRFYLFTYLVVGTDKLILKFIWIFEGPTTAKAILKSKLEDLH